MYGLYLPFVEVVVERECEQFYDTLYLGVNHVN
jgi:hypothetical protein